MRSRTSVKTFSVWEQLFITLLRLRRGFHLQTLAHFYDVCEGTIRRIFTTWIMFLFYHFKDYETLMFLPRNAFRENLPAVFRSFKNIRCIVDCTEIFCEVSRDYGRQSNIWSQYKHHTTMKCLIAVTPTGGACFISDLYEGSIDDVTLFEKCGILNHINPGDALLVDRGFTVQELLLSKQASIFIPPFLGGRGEINWRGRVVDKKHRKSEDKR